MSNSISRGSSRRRSTKNGLSSSMNSSPGVQQPQRIRRAGSGGVKAFFRHYLDAFPDTKVVMEDVIEEGDRITARFTYNGTFSNPFMGYRPNSAVVQMRSIDIWRVADGKFVEHWDELNLLEVFQQIGAATVRKPERQ